MKKILLSTIFILAMATLSAQTKPTTYCFVEGAEPLYLDHYRAEGEGAHPCLLFAFGGGFSHGDRAHEWYIPYFEKLMSSGFDVVSIDYRLGMAYTEGSDKEVGTLEGARMMYRAVNFAAEDVLRATKFLLDNAEKLGINPSLIVASGSSAGAIAVLQAENYLANHSKYAKILPKNFNFAGVVAFAGAIYSVLSKPHWHNKPCPIMLFHGNADRNVPYRKATILSTGFYGSDFIADQLHKKGATYYFHSAHYRDHILAVSPMYDNYDEIFSFLNRCVLNKEHIQHTNEFLADGIEPCQTEFTIREYLNSNYSK
ncbi:MAG: carboxylesterase family protein [Alistipes sp.]|nr:carboxylesterase family protein [Alistipes sp.]